MRISEKLDIELIVVDGTYVVSTEAFGLIKEEVFSEFASSSLYSQKVYRDKLAKGKICGGFILHESIRAEIFLDFELG